MNENEKILDECDKISKKAEINREILSRRYTRYNNLDNVFTFSTVTLSALIATVSMIDKEIIYSFIGIDTTITIRSIIAILGIFILVFTLFDKLWDFREKQITSEKGIDLLTNFLRDIHHFRKTRCADCNEEEAQDEMKKYIERYSQIQQYLPLLEDGIEFLKAKQSYLLKKEASKKLDENPESDMSTYHQKLKKLMKRW